ncbi:hypothetical protein [Desulfofustis glycolicus]|uniref:Uncharacterized protein n=1 Tax=Desulfofustis glycolicus DSM 9705 TaxID=1121409 RepID=A0A1M5XEZ1_9BACT|nr:hypothetical protein [Desulfofustis glycolicus]MCB2217928.1 hypothetical protein [Desulfobulbaceae bacterium]SHH97773.1 hypothetical protein SAMN02745124_02977 [Desulfofustis glycolicus DSM 9705]
MRDRLAELREEWYSEPDALPESDDEVVDDELLALEVLFLSRGVTVAGTGSVRVSEKDEEASADDGESSP